ncbi:glycoside hydrolase family 127 protein [Paludibacter sp.]
MNILKNHKHTFLSFLYVLIIPFLLNAEKQDSNSDFQKNTPVNFSQVKITDSFWLPRLKTHSEVTIPVCIDQCEHQTHRIKNFAEAGKQEKGEFKGIFYDDSDVYKMLEGAAYSLINKPDRQLEQKIDSFIALIAGAQQPDGYINTYYTLGDISKRWTDMNMHEMYCGGHLIEAGIAYYNATGKRQLLEVGIKFADHIYDTFGNNKRPWVAGHEEIELALIKLYSVTHDKKYIDFAHWLLEQRGHGYGTWGESAKDYYQDLVPVKDLKKISGHAVRAMYLFTGMADYSATTKDTTYLRALNSLWDNIVNAKMYLTGGIGSSAKNEGFTADYDLPNKEAYCETCASAGMIFWNQRMNMLKGDAKYVDILERALYNGLLSGVSLSGDRFFYVNPLESEGNHHRKAWYGTACCPSQISRFLPSIGNYIYATSAGSVWINLFISSSTDIQISKKNKVEISQTTNYPWDGNVTIDIQPQKSEKFEIKLRVPDWCKHFTVHVNGKPVVSTNDLSYLSINRKWKKNDKIQFVMDMPIEVVKADPRVLENLGKRAVQRGPIVYCAEETDNTKYNDLVLSPRTTYNVNYEPNMLGGIQVINALSNGNTYTFIPYYSWDNRDAGKMKVWIDYEE